MTEREPVPSHVLMTVDAVGGVWTYALDLAHELAARGIRVTLAVLGPAPSPEQMRAAQRVDGVSVRETGLTLDWMEDDPEQLTASGKAVSALAQALGVDLVHLNSPALAAGMSFSTPVVGACHSCLATWWDAVRGGALPPSFAWRTERLRNGYAACDRLIAPSRAFGDATARRYGVVPQIVHNGRDTMTTAAAPKKPVALTSGRLWDDGKNFRTLDRAAARMRRKVRTAGSLRGPNGEHVACENAASLGHLSSEALASELAEAAVFVSPALYEPFGLGVLEAAQAGCALVLSDIPTFRELWAEAAIFVSPLDHSGLAAALDELLDDPERCAQLGALARDGAARFTRQAMAGNTLEVYRAAMAQPMARKRAAA